MPAPVVLDPQEPVPIAKFVITFPAPLPILNEFTVMSLLVVKAEPVIETEPVKVCVLVRLFPKMLEPEEYTIEELTVETTKVWAVIVDVTVKEPVMDWSALKLLEPVVA